MTISASEQKVNSISTVSMATGAGGRLTCYQVGSSGASGRRLGGVDGLDTRTTWRERGPQVSHLIMPLFAVHGALLIEAHPN